MMLVLFDQGNPMETTSLCLCKIPKEGAQGMDGSLAEF